jgi:drug/metabolite transporter (DMT)-like permease
MKPVMPVRSTRAFTVECYSALRLDAVPAPLITVLVYMTVALCWAGNWVIGKIGVGAIPPIELSAVRFAIAGIVLLAIARATHSSLGLASWKPLLGAAFFGIFAYNCFVFIGLTLGLASDGALIVPTLNPVLTVLFATLIGERLTRRNVAGIAVATVGAVLVVVSAQTTASFSLPRLIGDLLMVGGAICWAVYATLGAITTRSGSPIGVSAVACLIGAAMLFPLGFLEHGYRDVPSWPLNAWLAVAYLTVFGTIVSFVLFYWAIRRFGAGPASMVSYLVPVFALLLAFFMLNERITLLEIAGGMVTLVGVRLATWRLRPGTPLKDASLV